MAVNIRPVVQTDRLRWEQLFSGYAEFYSVALPPGCHDRVWGWIFDSNNDFWCDPF
jgi:hypothetical protein